MHDPATLPDWIRANMVMEGRLEVDGVAYPWFLLRRTGKLAEESPPNFAGQTVWNGERLFIVSDDVPEPLRPFLLMQEMVEFEQLTDQSDRCVNAIKRVLRDVPRELLAAYLAFDRDFYRTMVPYAVAHQYPPDLIVEMRKALTYLESLTP